MTSSIEPPASVDGAAGARTSSPAAAFCPSCGAMAGSVDQFCRSCGARIQGIGSRSVEDATSDEPSSAPATPASAIGGGGRYSDRGKRVLAVGAIVVLAAGIAIAVVLTLGNSGPSAAQRHQHVVAARRRAASAHQAALHARLFPAFQQAMQLRTSFFIAERDFLAAMGDAHLNLRQYESDMRSVASQTSQITAANSAQQNACNQAFSTVACPNPTYPTDPTAPDVGGDVGQLRAAVSRLADLSAQALAVTPQPELKVLYAQLESAINQLSTDAQYNADTLTQAVTEPVIANPGDLGSVDQQQIATLHPELALPAIRIMNGQAVGLVQLLQLDITQYDVPGGTDADPSDHSFAR